MAISRMFRDHSWTWNRLQYGGAPFHYLYPPTFHVLTAAIPWVSLGRAFHLVAGCSYALTPVALYALTVSLFRSRFAGALAAIAYSLFPSPIYALLPGWKNLAFPYGNAPWGFVAMVGYEEAGHALGFAVALLALTAAVRNRWAWAAILASVVFLTNWPASIGLMLMLLGFAIVCLRDLVRPRTFGVVGVAYGLSAFWITPGYFVSSALLNRIVIRHVNSAGPWSATTTCVVVAGAALLAASVWRRRIPSAWARVLAWMAVLGSVVAAFSFGGAWLVPMPFRYMLELNGISVLALAGLATLIPQRWRLPIVATAIAISVIASVPFFRRMWSVQPPPIDSKTLLSFQLADALQKREARPRVFASGELDSTLALWSDVPQIGGTGQDVSNFLMFAAQREVAMGCSADGERAAPLWLQALGVSDVVVHGPASREALHWFAGSRHWNQWPAVWSNGNGDTIYHISGQSEAVVVDLRELRKLPALRSTEDVRFLDSYVRWSSGKRIVSVKWEGDDRVVIDADLGPEEGILLRSNYDAGWRVSGAELMVDPIGFTLIRSAPGRKSIAMHFGATWDVWLGRLTTIATILLLLLRVAEWRIALAAIAPAIIAYGILLHAVPTTARIADHAFARLKPPLINPGGVADSSTGQGAPFARGHILSIYGVNFGGGKDATSVWVSERKLNPINHNANVINVALPADAPSRIDVSVEVNGCRGNAFEFPTR